MKVGLAYVSNETRYFALLSRKWKYLILKRQETGTEHVVIATSTCAPSAIFCRVQHPCQVSIAFIRRVHCLIYTVRDQVRVCKLWDQQLLIHIVRKSLPRFTKTPSLVLIGPVLTEIQAFKKVKNLQRNVWKTGQFRTNVMSGFVRFSIHFFVHF